MRVVLLRLAVGFVLESFEVAVGSVESSLGPVGFRIAVSLLPGVTVAGDEDRAALDRRGVGSDTSSSAVL